MKERGHSKPDDAVEKRMRKGALPTKLCVTCQRSFTWRRKWARDWEQVRYCSERCRREG